MTETNARSKILEYLYKDSPSNKTNMAADLKLAYATLDKGLTDLRREGYVKSNGNGYWTITIEGKEQYENDPHLPAIQQAKDSSRLFSLSQFIDYAEVDSDCQAILEGLPEDSFDIRLIYPIVAWWFKCQGVQFKFGKQTDSQFDSRYKDIMNEFLTNLVRYSSE